VADLIPSTQIKAMNDGIKLRKANPKASSENSDKTRLTWTVCPNHRHPAPPGHRRLNLPSPAPLPIQDISLGPGDKLEAVVTAKLDKGRGRKNLKASTSYQLDNRTLESEDTVSIRMVSWRRGQSVHLATVHAVTSNMRAAADAQGISCFMGIDAVLSVDMSFLVCSVEHGAWRIGKMPSI
jgi:hypothetical protein